MKAHNFQPHYDDHLGKTCHQCTHCSARFVEGESVYLELLEKEGCVGLDEDFSDGFRIEVLYKHHDDWTVTDYGADKIFAFYLASRASRRIGDEDFRVKIINNETNKELK